MERSAIAKLAKAFAKVNGHPDPDGYAAAVADAHGEESKPAAKSKGKSK